jgi:hypothetical protein
MQRRNICGQLLLCVDQDSYHTVYVTFPTYSYFVSQLRHTTDVSSTGMTAGPRSKPSFQLIGAVLSSS